MASPANPIKYPPPHPPLSTVNDPVRMRCLVDTRLTSWVRPGIHCDGNPDNLSYFVSRRLAAPIAKMAPMKWAVVEIDLTGPGAGLPKDPELRRRYVGWLRDRYVISVSEEAARPQEESRAAPELAKAAEQPEPEGDGEQADESPPTASTIATAQPPSQKPRQTRAERRAAAQAGAG